MSGIEFPFVQLHNTGRYPCGGWAWLQRRIPVKGSLGPEGSFGSQDVAHLDGSPVLPYTRPVCDSCGESAPVNMDDVVPISQAAFG